MDRKFYLDLAAQGLKMPIGADLLLKSMPDHEARILDGKGLGEVVVETARRFKTPLAVPLMDLSVEKEWMMGLLDVPKEEMDTKHFETCPSDEESAKILDAVKAAKRPETPRMKANCAALQHVAKTPGLIPVGMAIGPFSLMTKLLSDPITGVFLAGSGMESSDCEEVKMVERSMELSLAMILKSIRMQVEAGAKAICLCEPAANKVYISPKQIEEGSNVFERFVLKPNLSIKALLDELGADLVFHDCGELTAAMLSSFNQLRPSILSLGSSRALWDDAKFIAKDTVLFGNLPSKKFYSDKEISKEQVAALSKHTLERMRAVGHPFILGSECDVLSVPGCADTIMGKVEAMLSA